MTRSTIASGLLIISAGMIGWAIARAAEPGKPLAARVQHENQMPVENKPWATLRWLMNGKIDPESSLTLGISDAFPNMQAPLHIHANSDEVIYILSGSCEQRVGNETVVLKPGDVIRVPAGVPHCAKTLGSEPVRSIVVYNSGNRQFKAVEEK